MNASDNAPVFDPGRGWRRVIRCGVFFFAFMLTLAYLLEGASPWLEFLALWREATTADDLSMHYGISLGALCSLKVFSCCICSLYFSSPLLLLVASREVHATGWRRVPYLVLAHVLWLLALLPPYCFGIYQLNAVGSEEIRAAMISGLSLYLLFGLLTFVNAWRARKSALMVMWLCVYPISTVVVAMGFLVSAQLLMRRTIVSGFLIIAVTGFAGSVFFLTAFLKWWGAVRRAIPDERRNSRNESLKPAPTIADTV